MGHEPLTSVFWRLKPVSSSWARSTQRAESSSTVSSLWLWKCDSSVREDLSSPVLGFLTAPAAAAAWLHCISFHTKKPARYSVHEHGGIKPGWEAARRGFNCETVAWRGADSVRGSRPQRSKCVSGLCCFRCGRCLEVWWQKSSESLASPPLLCWMSGGVRCHSVLQILKQVLL